MQRRSRWKSTMDEWVKLRHRLLIDANGMKRRDGAKRLACHTLCGEEIQSCNGISD